MSDYTYKEELLELKNKVDKLENEINRLKENKVDSLALEKTIGELKININSISQRMEELTNDRKEDKEMINSMRLEINKLIETIHSSNLSNEIIKVNQKNMDEKMDTYQDSTQEKIKGIKDDLKETNTNINELTKTVGLLAKSIDETPLKIFLKTYKNKENKKFRFFSNIAIIVFILGLLSIFSFFMKNGIPWGDIKEVVDLIK